MTYRQPKTRAADCFRSEEGLENMLENVWRNPGTRVSHFDDDSAALAGPRRDSNLVAVGVPGGNRLRGVHQQVHKHLPEPCFIGLHRRDLVQLPDEPRALMEFMRGAPNRPFDRPT